MKLILKYSILIFVFCFITSCSKKHNDNKDNQNSSYTISEDDNLDNEVEVDDDYIVSTSDCGIVDGSYSASVDYNNPETGYSATYTLDLDVVDCQVVQINFPNDGYLDEDNISAADLDEDGNATVYGEDGKTYEIKIDN